jgi:formate hydrogenlyase subunit 6/NADH:ubiquinone oxidoreductase subunit I
MEKKRCFECKKIKTLDCFTVNSRKYQLKADMGRCIVCHSCTKARALRDMKLIILNSETQKFETLYFKSKNQVLKHIKELKLQAKL